MNNLTEQSRYKGAKKFKSLQDLRIWIAQDFSNLVQYYNHCNVFKTGRIQVQIANELQCGKEIILLMAFRNSTKTYLVDLYCLWRLHRYPNTRILVLSAKEGNATRHMGNFKRMLKLMPAFHYMQFSKWTESGFQLSHATDEAEDTFTTASINSTVTSMHIDLIVADDCEVRKNTETPALRNKLIERYSEFESLLHSPGRHCKDKEHIPMPERTTTIYIGTPHSEFSTYFVDKEVDENGEEEPHPLSDAHIIKIPAINAESGKSNFPEVWPMQRLAKKKSRMSKPAWFLQYMLDPSGYDKEAAVVDFKSILIQSCNIKDAVMTVDPAGEKGGGDEHAICIGGFASGVIKDPSKPKVEANLVHIKKIAGTKVKANDFVDWSLKIAKEHGVEKILVESNFGAYCTLFQNKVAEQGNWCSVEALRTTMKKEERLVETLDPMINAHKVSFERSCFEGPEAKETVTQFKSWTYKSLPENDDRIDAVSLLVQYHMTMLANTDGFTWDSAALQEPW